MKAKSNSLLLNIFFLLVCAAVTAPLWVTKELLFPFVTTKAFVLRVGVELALPFYVYLLIREKTWRPNLNPVRERLDGSKDSRQFSESSISPSRLSTIAFSNGGLNLALIGFVIVNWLSAFLGVNVNRSLWGNFERMGGSFYLTHLALLYFYILLLGQAGGKHIQRLLQFFLFVAAVIGLNGVSGWLGGPTLTLDPSLPGRASSTLGNPIYLGSFLIIPLFLSAYFAKTSESLGAKIYYWLLATASLLAIFQSGTRGAVVGLIAASFISFIVFLIFTRQKTFKLIGGLAVVIFIAAAGLLFAHSDKLPPGSTLRRVFQLRDSNTQARLIQWRVALQGFKDRPVLGTGPENYYLVANRYYNAELYQYDRSWFDKPHNYLLEILVTNGVLGLMAYLSILVLALLIIYQGFKNSFLSLFETCLLLAAFLAYQIQNLFVFDTVPASVAFYCFLAFLAYLGYEIKYQKPQTLAKTDGPGRTFSQTVFGLAGALSLYLIYATNLVPALVSRNVNYGYAYAAVDAQKAVNYFEKAINYPFNFDFSETGSKFSEFANAFAAKVDRSKPASLKLAQAEIGKALAYQAEVAAKISNDPVAWQKLSDDYLYDSAVNGKPLPNQSVEALQKAIQLAPQRVEARIALTNLLLFGGQKQSALQLMEQAVALDSKYSVTRWQLALVYNQAGEKDKALAAAQKALELGYQFKDFSESQWLTDIYKAKPDYPKAIAIYERAMEKNQLKVDDYLALVELYVKAGQMDKAKSLADKIIAVDKSNKAALDKILKGK